MDVVNDLDKDLSSGVTAREIHADILVITTGVEKVSIHFGKPNQHALDTVDVLTMARYMQEGHFPPGSMLPKILASLEFLERGGKRVIITTPECCPRHCVAKQAPILSTPKRRRKLRKATAAVNF